MKMYLVIDVAEGADPEDIATDINCAILCTLEEDKKTIIGWEWKRTEEKEIGWMENEIG